MESETNLEEYSNIWKSLMFLGIIFVLISVVSIFFEFYEANKFCKSENLEHSFDFRKFRHYCGTKKIYQYNDGWDFERISISDVLKTINFSNITKKEYDPELVLGVSTTPEGEIIIRNPSSNNSIIQKK